MRKEGGKSIAEIEWAGSKQEIPTNRSPVDAPMHCTRSHFSERQYSVVVSHYTVIDKAQRSELLGQDSSRGSSHSKRLARLLGHFYLQLPFLAARNLEHGFD